MTLTRAALASKNIEYAVHATLRMTRLADGMVSHRLRDRFQSIRTQLAQYQSAGAVPTMTVDLVTVVNTTSAGLVGLGVAAGGGTFALRNIGAGLKQRKPQDASGRFAGSPLPTSVRRELAYQQATTAACGTSTSFPLTTRTAQAPAQRAMSSTP